MNRPFGVRTLAERWIESPRIVTGSRNSCAPAGIRVPWSLTGGPPSRSARAARALGREVAAPVEPREVARRDAEHGHGTAVERRRLSLEPHDRDRVERRRVCGADRRRVGDEPRILFDRVVERNLERGAIRVVADQRRAVRGREDREADADAHEDDCDRGRPGSPREREQRKLERERPPGRRPFAGAEHRLQHARDHDRGDERDQSRQQHQHDPGALARRERLRVGSSDREGDEHRDERAGGGDICDRDRQPADRDGAAPGSRGRGRASRARRRRASARSRSPTRPTARRPRREVCPSPRRAPARRSRRAASRAGSRGRPRAPLRPGRRVSPASPWRRTSRAVARSHALRGGDASPRGGRTRAAGRPPGRRRAGAAGRRSATSRPRPRVPLSAPSARSSESSPRARCSRVRCGPGSCQRPSP